MDSLEPLRKCGVIGDADLRREGLRLAQGYAEAEVSQNRGKSGLGNPGPGLPLCPFVVPVHGSKLNRNRAFLAF